MITIDDAT